MNLSDIHPVTEFRAMLEGCDAYPDDVAAVPEPLTGTAAFPASSGLVRPAGSTELPPFPYGGLMVIGHDVDSLDLHEDRRERGIADGDIGQGYVSATWFGLYRLLDLGGVPREDVYVTSMYVGPQARAERRAVHPCSHHRRSPTGAIGSSSTRCG